MAKKKRYKPSDKKLSNDEKLDIIISLLSVVPYVACITIYLFTLDTVILAIGLSYLAANMVVEIVSDVLKNPDNDQHQADIIKFDEGLEPELKKVISKEVTKERLKDFQQRKKEEQKEGSKEAKLIDNDYGFTKEEAVTYLLDTINDYYKRYDLPAWTITPNDWDKFFDIMYSAYQNKDIKNVFFNDMFQLIKVFFANALIDSGGALDINDLNNSLKYLSGSKFTEREILLLQKHILTKLNENKIVKFDESYTRK